jgi:hypothetical protein
VTPSEGRAVYLFMPAFLATPNIYREPLLRAALNLGWARFRSNGNVGA